MKPTSFTVIFDEAGNLDTEKSESTVFVDNFCSFAVRRSNNSFIKYESSSAGFHLFIGEYTPAHPELTCTRKYGQGTNIIYNATQRSLTIKSDYLGTSIVYYQRLGTLFEVSNRLENLSLINSKINWSAIQQYLNSGYTISDDTFFTSIHQTIPNQIVTITSVDGLKTETTIECSKAMLNNLPRKELEEKVLHRLTSILNSETRSTLMMSAGWDSRTLLSNGSANYHAAYTHGDLSSREISIARRLTGTLRLNHHFIDSTSLQLDLTLLETMLENLGFCVFPIWYLSSLKIDLMKSGPISSGVLGELIGGHYGLLSIGKRIQKLLSAALMIHDGFLNESKVLGMIDRFSTPAKEHWFLTPEYNALFQENASNTKTRMLEKLLKLRKTEGNWQEAVENFNMEHRARQYILKQAQASSSTIGYVLPFGDDQLTKLVKSIAFKYRVHNKLNQRILSSKSPQLLNAPMAATLINARYPIIIQELSRGIRILIEETTKRLGLSPPRLGWFNYEHIYQSDVFQNLITSLRHKMWDQDRMLRTIETNESLGIDAGSTLDMLCKIKTIDYYLILQENLIREANYEKNS